jgi:putative transposase
MKIKHEWHCVYGIYYHLVLVVAYRRKVITDLVRERCIEIIRSIAPGFDVEVLEADGGADHIHLLIEAKPQTTISKFVNSTKTVTSRRLKAEFPNIRQELWKEKFWSRSYFVATTGGAPLEAVKAYIENQRK